MQHHYIAFVQLCRIQSRPGAINAKLHKSVLRASAQRQRPNVIHIRVGQAVVFRQRTDQIAKRIDAKGLVEQVEDTLLAGRHRADFITPHQVFDAPTTRPRQRQIGVRAEFGGVFVVVGDCIDALDRLRQAHKIGALQTRLRKRQGLLAVLIAASCCVRHNHITQLDKRLARVRRFGAVGPRAADVHVGHAVHAKQRRHLVLVEPAADVRFRLRKKARNFANDARK